ncbi:MAG: 16S rRNA (uracil(1498)-N(3))-methyltransferase [Cyanobacteria bacterium P01_A01_bin.105]
MNRPLQRITVDPAQIQQGQLQLTPDQRHYLRRVLRLATTDRFIAQDGQGQQWQAELQPQTDRAVLLAPLVAQPAGPPLTLAAALPKQGFDDVVRQVTELGVTTIQPLISDRTLLSPSDKKLERWRRIAQEAAEQCERSWVPTIHAPCPYRDWLSTLALEHPTRQTYLCVARHQGRSFLSRLEENDLPFTEQEIIIAIGPEGGWTDEEITVAKMKGCIPISLGSAILRATTAAVAAISVVSIKLSILS